MIEYFKVQSNGNNFLLLNNMTMCYDEAQIKRITIRDCDIKKGVGADGVLVLESSEIQDFKMRIFNANGFESEMCGNGARCVAKYAFDTKIAGKFMKFETLAGVISAEVDGMKVKIGMGEISTLNTPEMLKFQSKEINTNYYYLTVGVPHVVVISQNAHELSRAEMVSIGSRMDNSHEIFSEGTNVNFVSVLENNTINSTTYERGVEDLTDSCGTGSCASAIFASVLFGMKSPIEVINPGGINKVYLEFNMSQNNVEVFLEGNVNYSAKVSCPDFDEEDVWFTQN